LWLTSVAAAVSSRGFPGRRPRRASRARRAAAAEARMSVVRSAAIAWLIIG
jgi:hypothetical protein